MKALRIPVRERKDHLDAFLLQFFLDLVCVPSLFLRREPGEEPQDLFELLRTDGACDHSSVREDNCPLTALDHQFLTSDGIGDLQIPKQW